MNTLGHKLYAIGIAWTGCLLSFTLSAQTFTLDECIEWALKNNVRMKNADNNVQAAQHQKQSAFTRYFPSVGASGGSFWASNDLLQMELAPGQEVGLVKNGVVGGVTATLPLFAGGQIVNGNKLAEANVEMARLARRQSADEVRLTVERYFWQVVMLKEKLHTLDALQTQLEQIRNEADAAVEAGVTNRNDLLQVQLRVNETRSQAIALRHDLGVSRSLLAQYVGHPADSLDVAWAMDDGLPTRPDGLYQSPETSLPLTTDYRLLNQQVQACRLQQKIAVGKNLPTVALGGGYLYENLLDRDHTFWMGGITVSVPLTKWWSGSHEIKRQKLQTRNAENQLADQTQLLLIRMQQQWNALRDAYAQVEIALESISQADENLRLQTDYYQAGLCTMSDLLEAQSLYQQSRDRYVESYAGYEVKKREYLQATGR